MFNSEEEVREFLILNTPDVYHASKKAHTTYKLAFTSNIAMKEVIDCLTEKLWERQLTQEIINQAKQDDTRI